MFFFLKGQAALALLRVLISFFLSVSLSGSRMLRTLSALGGRALTASTNAGALTATASAAASASTSFSSSSQAPSRSFAAAAKETTGIVGLEVDPQARVTLRTKLGRVMAALDDAGVPASAQYRMGLAALCGER